MTPRSFGFRALLALILALGAVVAFGLPASGEKESGGGNGYVLMVHGWFEPYPEGQPHAAGVAVAVRDGDHLTFSAIPYSVATGRPAVVGDARLDVVDPDTRQLVRSYRPNVGSDNPPCRRETGFEGHEGPLQACPTFRAHTSDFGGRHVVGFVFRFTDDAGRARVEPYSEPYSMVNHSLLHGYLQAGVPQDLATADRDGGPDRFVLESDLDPMPPTS